MQMPLQTCRQDDLPPNQMAMVTAISRGHANFARPQASSSEQSDSPLQDSSSSSRGNDSLQLFPPRHTDDRQDVLIFHLRDDPIRVFLGWNSYEPMMLEMAHHFAVNREDVVDAYESILV